VHDLGEEDAPAPDSAAAAVAGDDEEGAEMADEEAYDVDDDGSEEEGDEGDGRDVGHSAQDAEPSGPDVSIRVRGAVAADRDERPQTGTSTIDV
jgi:hypothetical protein